MDDAEVPTHELICRRYGAGRAEFVKADVRVAGEVEALVGRAVEVGGRLDV